MRIVFEAFGGDDHIEGSVGKVELMTETHDVHAGPAAPIASHVVALLEKLTRGTVDVEAAYFEHARAPESLGHHLLNSCQEVPNFVVHRGCDGFQ
jgi:hypothetical protein